MKKIYDAIIIGSGAAAFSAADWLYKAGVTDIAVVSENRLSGTSRNTGSDKQTYYKLSMDGFHQDSAYKMASDMFGGGSCDGEKMYLQALNSTRCFLRLCDYGVGFPQDEFGGFPGYKTDHDSSVRATSVGPLTSKMMTEKLESVVLDKNKTPLFDGRQVVEILKKGNIAVGVTALNTKNDDLEDFYASNVICATGAPACIYESSVYPESQHGMTGVLIESGVKLCNFSQWQYGMASVDFRWNVSGSFMQVMPKFVSVDESGNEHEFLADCFLSTEEMLENIFLKGYQWPFSYGRLTLSSRIDIAVHNETKKGRKVYLDYTANPKGYSEQALCAEAAEYLQKNGAFGETPIKRLEKLNPKAIDLYKNNNIDLYAEKLRIAVCAQHNNGGVHTDKNYETDIKGLYVIGEAAGTFGLARPGGSALNDTQVGGLLCAKHIAAQKTQKTDVDGVRSSIAERAVDFEFDESIDYSFIKAKMSKSASFIRNKEECTELLEEIKTVLSAMPFRHKSLSAYFYDRDMLVSAKALLETVLGEMPLTGSRGGAVFTENGCAAEENIGYRDYVTVTDCGEVYFEKVSPVPLTDEPFEKYLKKV